MKIAILGMNKIKYMPYIQIYLQALKNKDVEIHVLNWNRDLTSEPQFDNIEIYSYEKYQENDVPKIKKIKNFVGYRIFLLQKIKKEKYNKIICLHSLTALLIFPYLINKYKKRFILDFRDLTFEKNKLYAKLIKYICKNAEVVLSSSEGFLPYLTNNAVIVHNTSSYDVTYKSKPRNKTIKIAFWGFIRQIEYNKRLISLFGNDENFELYYYGFIQNSALKLLDFVKEKKYTNIYFMGGYTLDEIEKYAAEVDFIDNMYEPDFTTKGATGNKYYDGIKFAVPQICQKGTIMGELIESKKLGLTLDVDNFDKQQIIRFYNEINYEEFVKNCEEQMLTIREQNEKVVEIIQKFAE